jgi:carbonic anhydrase
VFDDLLAANQQYSAQFRDAGLRGKAARGLAVLTCIDSRIDPLAMLGLEPGDAKILRNAGARVTEDSLRSLILATSLLGVTRICIVHHTDCAMSGVTDDDLRAEITRATGRDADDFAPLAAPLPYAAMKTDIAAVRNSPLIPKGVLVGAFLYDVHTGSLTPTRY